MDDCLKSLPSEADAIQHGDSLRALLSRGGFKISKWISNSRNVLETIPGLERSKDIKNIDARKEELLVQRALGVQRCVETNSFRFQVYINSRPPTHRGILSVASSIFDPLGFLAPFVLNAKYIMQDL